MNAQYGVVLTHLLMLSTCTRYALLRICLFFFFNSRSKKEFHCFFTLANRRAFLFIPSLVITINKMQRKKEIAITIASHRLAMQCNWNYCVLIERVLRSIQCALVHKMQSKRINRWSYSDNVNIKYKTKQKTELGSTWNMHRAATTWHTGAILWERVAISSSSTSSTSSTSSECAWNACQINVKSSLAWSTYTRT